MMASRWLSRRTSRSTPRRRSVALGAAVCGVAVMLAAGGCVSAPPRSSPGTTQVAPASFCDPIRALSTDAWTDSPDRAVVVHELSDARGHAPAGVHADLDTLLALEQSGVHPTSDAGTTGSTPPSVDRWFDAMSALAEVAMRECDIDLVAAALATTEPGAAGPGSGSAVPLPADATTFEDIVAVVRASNPAARWVDGGFHGIVGEATADAGTQIVVFDVADADLGRTICTDVVAALDEPAATVIIRNPAGLVIVERIDGTCETLPTP
jgi:hypothetical protein